MIVNTNMVSPPFSSLLLPFLPSLSESLVLHLVLIAPTLRVHDTDFFPPFYFLFYDFTTTGITNLTIGVDHRRDACGDGSDCINRLTQVECLPDDCRCRSYCQNQRSVKKESMHTLFFLFSIFGIFSLL